MRTKSVSIFYQITPNEIISPAVRELERKDRYIKEVQKTVAAEWEPKYIKVTYEEHNPEIERQRRFFNGTCVKYYAIQNMDMFVGEPSNEIIKQYREQILDEMLGYDLALVNRVVRRRKSTTDFRSMQAWNKFLNLLEETLFDSAGYEFPDSKEFWDLVKLHGYDQAERISIEQLQAKMKRK
jgi:hypothetical protein